MRKHLAPLALLWCVEVGIASEPDATIPFEFIHNQIVLKATINGRGPYNVVVDTGTFTSAVDLKLARHLRLPLGVAAAVTAGAGAGRTKGHRTVCARIEIGGVVTRNLAAVALDLSAAGRQLGRPLHGVLGYAFLSSRVVQVDYFHRIVRFCSSPSGTHALEGARSVSLPMRIRPGSVLPVIEDCSVNGTHIPLSLDTGSSLGLVLFPRAVERLGLTNLARSGVDVQATGYLGQAYLKRGWVRSLVVKTLDLGAIEAAYVERGYADDEDPSGRGGSLGNAVLQDFILTLDYPNRTIALEQWQ